MSRRSRSTASRSFRWAGPVFIVVGAEHRRDEVSGNNDLIARRMAGGRRQLGEEVLNASTALPKVCCKLLVLLVEDKSWAKSFDLEAAAKLYVGLQHVGPQATWKGGLTYSPVSDVMFRATRSTTSGQRPNLQESLQRGRWQVSRATATRFWGGNATESVPSSTGRAIRNSCPRSQTTRAWASSCSRAGPRLQCVGRPLEFSTSPMPSAPSRQQTLDQCAAGNQFDVWCDHVELADNTNRADQGRSRSISSGQIARGIDLGRGPSPSG